jgi:hypothetical protein
LRLLTGYRELWTACDYLRLEESLAQARLGSQEDIAGDRDGFYSQDQYQKCKNKIGKIKNRK